MHCALQNYYKIFDNEAAELLKNINIYHPYGSVGLLPKNRQSAGMPFGEEPNSKQLLDLANGIKTFTEGTDPESSEILEIRKYMGAANKLIFLGFAFHKLNMQLISPENIKSKKDVTKCLATTYEISDSDKEEIGEQISKLYDGKITVKMTNSKCCAFFTEFWRNLTF